MRPKLLIYQPTKIATTTVKRRLERTYRQALEKEVCRKRRGLYAVDYHIYYPAVSLLITSFKREIMDVDSAYYYETISGNEVSCVLYEDIVMNEDGHSFNGDEDGDRGRGGDRDRDRGGMDVDFGDFSDSDDCGGGGTGGESISGSSCDSEHRDRDRDRGSRLNPGIDGDGDGDGDSDAAYMRGGESSDEEEGDFFDKEEHEVRQSWHFPVVRRFKSLRLTTNSLSFCFGSAISPYPQSPPLLYMTPYLITSYRIAGRSESGVRQPALHPRSLRALHLYLSLVADVDGSGLRRRQWQWQWR
jgi:hypothetical protein